MKGYLKLATGTCFEGEFAGKFHEACGEVVFFTGMTGYQEVVSDPSFKGQIVVFTYPLIGNYGINACDFESMKPQVSGVILGEVDERGDHWLAESSFVTALNNEGIPVLSGVDTRGVVQQIRAFGDIPGVLTMNLEHAEIDEDAQYQTNWVKEVAGKKIETLGKGYPHIALIDFGYKKSIADALLALGCKVTVVPYHATFNEVERLEPDGILLSNGPGNPKRLAESFPFVKKLALSYPTLGICLGHQLLALAFGGDTEKLKFGHRGANQPVQDLATGRVGMTAQNHSYVVKESSLNQTDFQVRFLNINDGSVEGMAHQSKPIVSVQFHPEGHPGPADFQFIFEDFIAVVKEGKVYAEA